jgi:hypothetical protein
MRFLTRTRCPPYLKERVRNWIYYTYEPKAKEAERNAILQVCACVCVCVFVCVWCVCARARVCMCLMCVYTRILFLLRLLDMSALELFFFFEIYKFKMPAMFYTLYGFFSKFVLQVDLNFNFKSPPGLPPITLIKKNNIYNLFL